MAHLTRDMALTEPTLNAPARTTAMCAQSRPAGLSAGRPDPTGPDQVLRSCWRTPVPRRIRKDSKPCGFKAVGCFGGDVS